MDEADAVENITHLPSCENLTTRQPSFPAGSDSDRQLGSLHDCPGSFAHTLGACDWPPKAAPPAAAEMSAVADTLVEAPERASLMKKIV